MRNTLQQELTRETERWGTPEYNCEVFYEEHLAGHTTEELRRARDFDDRIAELGSEAILASIRNERFFPASKFVDVIAAENHVSRKTVRRGLRLAKDLCTYMRMYREAYGEECQSLLA